MAATDEAEDAAWKIITRVLPLALRAARVVVVFTLAYAMLVLQPFQPANHLAIAALIAVMSGLASTRPAAIIGLGILLAMVILPPQLFAFVPRP